MHGGRPTDDSARDERRDRGQLLLIAGLGIAVAFVALALVVNSVVFTHNLATRPSPDGGEAMEYQDVVRDGVGGVVSEANARYYTGHGDLRDSLRGDVRVWSNLTLHQYGAFGTLTNVSVRDVTNGTSVHQATAREFTDRTGDGSWALFSGANGARRFQMNLTDERAGTLTVTTTFTNGTTHTTSIDTGATVTVDDCPASAPPATVDFSNASVDGAHCDALAFFDSGTVQEISFDGGTNAHGRYVVVVNATPGSLYTSESYTDHYYAADSPSPYALPAVYAATLNATYRAPDITYTTRVRVRPNATPQGPRYGVVTSPGDVVFQFNNGLKNLSTVNASGRPVRLPPANVSVTGPREYDFTGDDVLDVPYVNSSGVLYLANTSGSTQALATNAYHTKSLLAVGRWNGSEPSVFYAGTNKETIYRIRPGMSSPALVLDGAVTAVTGVGDIDGDGANELVYVGTSQQLYYFDGDGSTHKINNGGAGQNQGIGVGAPVDYDGDGVARVPFVDGSGNLLLINTQGSQKLLSQAAAKSPVTSYDIDDDSRLEVVYLNEDGQIWYVDNVLGSPTAKQLENATGGAIVADKATGVA